MCKFKKSCFYWRFFFFIVVFLEIGERVIGDGEFILLIMDFGFDGYFNCLILNFINNGLGFFNFVDGCSNFIWLWGFFFIFSFVDVDGFIFVINLLWVCLLGIVWCFCVDFFCIDFRYMVIFRLRLLFNGRGIGLLDCCCRLIFFFKIVFVLEKWCWCKYFKMILMVFVIVILMVWVIKW